MPDNGTGTYSLPLSYRVTNGDTTDESQHNPPFEDVAQALTDRVHRDGRSSWTGNHNANGNRLTGLAAPTSDNDAVRRAGTLSAWALNLVAAMAKTTPVDADYVSLVDTEAANAPKKVLWSAIKDALKTFFDTIYGDARLTVEDQVITGGARVTSKELGTAGVVDSGTLTLDPGDRPLQHYTNNGAHTLAPGSNAGTIVLDITNDSSAGAITTSGFTKVDGDAFTTTNGHKFRCSVSVGNAGSLLVVQALQ